jgi:trk system potassium uptake protein TrkA
MRIIIAGAGTVGFHLAKQLVQEGHDISVIEQDPDIYQRISELDILPVLGNATSQRLLKEAGIQEAQMVVAVTPSDEVNIMICHLASKFHVPTKIARIRNTEYTLKESVLNPTECGVDLVVNPEEVVVHSIVELVQTPGCTDVAEFAGGKILLRGFKIPPDAPIAGKRLVELRDIATLDAFLIAAVSRGQKLTIPKGEYTLRAGDTIFVLVSEDTFPLFLPLIRRRLEEVSSAIVYGGRSIGRTIAGKLEQILQKVALIEPSEKLAELAAGELSKTVVLNGDGTDAEILKEAGAVGTDLFISVTADDESNTLASLLAKSMGAKRTATLTQNPDYVSLLESIGIDIVLNPRLITVSKILQFMRKGKIMSVFKLHENEAEVIELEVVPGSRIVGKRLQDLDFPQDAVIGAVIRNGVIHIPDGNTVLKDGEHVVVFAQPDAISTVERLFTHATKLF